ncbi:hypothetical protein C8Q76DRAFT_800905 [Earliella scabrosa]|nr:hypothetical protein C8Q76DRAFT_800905 [Earliella scabrosa]
MADVTQERTAEEAHDAGEDAPKPRCQECTYLNHQCDNSTRCALCVLIGADCVRTPISEDPAHQPIVLYPVPDQRSQVQAMDITEERTAEEAHDAGEDAPKPRCQECTYLNHQCDNSTRCASCVLIGADCVRTPISEDPAHQPIVLCPVPDRRSQVQAMQTNATLEQRPRTHANAGDRRHNASKYGDTIADQVRSSNVGPSYYETVLRDSTSSVVSPPQQTAHPESSMRGLPVNVRTPQDDEPPRFRILNTEDFGYFIYGSSDFDAARSHPARVTHNVTLPSTSTSAGQSTETSIVPRPDTTLLGIADGRSSSTSQYSNSATSLAARSTRVLDASSTSIPTPTPTLNAVPSSNAQAIFRDLSQPTRTLSGPSRRGAGLGLRQMSTTQAGARSPYVRIAPRPQSQTPNDPRTEHHHIASSSAQGGKATKYDAARPGKKL